MSDTIPTLKVLVINVGTEPIQTERFEFPIREKDLARQTVLNVMNRMGKNSEAIVKHGDKWSMYSHTAPRGPSKELFHSKLTYHPMMEALK